MWICIIVYHCHLFKLNWLFRNGKKNLWKCPRWNSFDILKLVFLHIGEVNFLEGIGISLLVPLRCKWSTWALRNFNLIPTSEGEKGGLLNSSRKTVRSLCLYRYIYVYVYLINMRCLCLQMALPRLVRGWALFHWLKKKKLSMMPKTWPLCTSAKSKFRDRILSKVEKNSLLLCQAKGATAGSCPQNCVSQPGGIWWGVL